MLTKRAIAAIEDYYFDHHEAVGQALVEIVRKGPRLFRGLDPEGNFRFEPVNLGGYANRSLVCMDSNMRVVITKVSPVIDELAMSILPPPAGFDCYSHKLVLLALINYYHQRFTKHLLTDPDRLLSFYSHRLWERKFLRGTEELKESNRIVETLVYIAYNKRPISAPAEQNVIDDDVIEKLMTNVRAFLLFKD